MRTFAIALLLAAAPTVARAADWEPEPSHSAISFTVKHMMITNVHGQITGVKGTVSWTKPDFSDAKIDLTADPSTVDTREPKRDAHLKSPDFFDVAKFPTLSFKSTKVTKQGDKVKIAGELTLHGVTKSVTFEATPPTKEMKSPWGTTLVAASATTKINRKDFGLNWNKALEAGGVLVGEEVALEVNLELVKKATQEKAER
jgi:polyisoprenoid-binding protein YceI